jgi:hypothetical protein
MSETPFRLITCACREAGTVSRIALALASERGRLAGDRALTNGAKMPKNRAFRSLPVPFL